MTSPPQISGYLQLPRPGVCFFAWVCAALLIPAIGNNVSASSSLSGTQPNIIVFVTDDQDKRTLGYYGGDYPTPTLDQFAAQGMIFENHHVTATLCSPSRYSILTGRYPESSPVDSQYTNPPNQMFVTNNRGLGRSSGVSEATNGKILKDFAGYRTGYVGKFHLVSKNANLYNDLPAHGSLVDFTGSEDPYTPSVSADALSNQEIYEDFIATHGFDFVEAVNWENLKAPFNNHNPEWNVEAAIDFLDSHGSVGAHNGTPFYLYFASTLMHGTTGSWSNSLDADPALTPDGVLASAPDVSAYMPSRQSVKDRVDALGFTPGSAEWRTAAGLLWLDDSFGAILAKLDEIGLTNDTLVIWASDHGSDYKGGLLGADGTNSAMVARWPVGISAGTLSHSMVQTTDYAPTFFDAAGVTSTQLASAGYRLDGLSLLEHFDLSGAEPPGWRSSLYFAIGDARAVLRNDGMKYTAFRPNAGDTQDAINEALQPTPDLTLLADRLGYTHRPFDERSQEDHPEYFTYDLLYDLTIDPLETLDVAADPAYAGRLAEMKSLLQGYLNTFTRGNSFGEFIPGGDAQAPVNLSAEFALARSLYHPSAPVWFADANANGLSDHFEANLSASPPAGFSSTSDVDGDGFDELLEWGAGTNPLNPNSSPINFFEHNGHRVASYRLLFEPGYILPPVFEFSTDLQTWTAGPAPPAVMNHRDRRGMAYKDLWQYLPDGDRLFVRIRVPQPAYP